MVHAVQLRFSMPLQQWNGILSYIMMFFEQHHMCLIIKIPGEFISGLAGWMWC